MSAHVLLKLLNQLRKRDKMRGLPSILSFFATCLINSIKHEHDLSYDIKITLQSRFGSKIGYSFVILYAMFFNMDIIAFPENL